MITPAFAQSAPAAAGGGDMLIQMLPFVLIFVIMWFLIIRPQQKRAKEHQARLSGIRRGDTVVLSGGLVGKVTKAGDEPEIEIEIAEGVKVKAVKAMVADVRSKTDPVKA